MDSLVSSAARALEAGDPLGALQRVALRDDPPALALRGIAMAQLGEFARARQLLRRAARAFGSQEAVAQARCVTAQAEIALATRDLSGVGSEVERAAELFEAHGERVNALFARLLEVRRLLLLGRVEDASQALGRLSLRGAPPRLSAVAELVRADLYVRALDTRRARAALTLAAEAAHAARIPPLSAEIERARRNLEAPAARLLGEGAPRALRLDEVEAVLGSGELVVDACRREVRAGRHAISLLRRPVLFALALALGERAGSELTREELVARAFGARRLNESYRVRLRVEIGRLRRALAPMAELRATPGGFALAPLLGRRALVLLPPAPGEASALVALLQGGEAWSTSSLAAALGQSQRTVQRALAALEQSGEVRGVGLGRARRWVAPPSSGFATTLLLVARGAL